jgi:Na+/glutamate symporter
MTDAVAIQIAQTAGIVFTTIGSIFAAWFSYKAKANSQRNTEHITDIKQDVVEVKRQTNHIKDELVATTARAALAEGKAEGRAEEKAEQNKENA